MITLPQVHPLCPLVFHLVLYRTIIEHDKVKYVSRQVRVMNLQILWTPNFAPILVLQW